MIENIIILVAMLLPASIIMGVCLLLGMPAILIVSLSALGLYVGYLGMENYLGKLRVIE